VSENAGRQYAGFWRRFVAYFIDWLMFSVLWFAVFKVSGFWDSYYALATGSFSTPDRAIDVDMLGTVFWMNQWMWIAWTVYIVAATASPMRGTIGKYFMDIAVVDSDGRGIGLFRSLVRELSKFLSALIFLIGFIMAGFTPKKRALHDFIVMSVAVRATDWPVQKAKKTTSLRLIGNAFATLVCGVALAFPIYSIVNKKVPYELKDPKIQAIIEGVNQRVADRDAESNPRTATSAAENLIAKGAPRRRAMDFEGIDILREKVEEHAINKQVFPKSFGQLGIAAGDLFDLGIQKVDVRDNGVLTVKFKPETRAGGATLVMAPYLDNDGYIKWDCRSLQLRDADFPEACDE